MARLINRVFEKFGLRKKLKPGSSEVFAELRAGDIAIDCGANVGVVTEKMAERGAEVHAFEPNPHAFKVLKERFKDNPKVTCHNKGVWNRNSTIKLYLHENAEQDQVHWSTGSSLLSFKGNVRKSTFVNVEVIDLIDFIENLNKPVKLVKMDIEGAECEVLEKLIETEMYKQIGQCVVETHEEKIPELRPKMREIRDAIKVNGIKNINLNWI